MKYHAYKLQIGAWINGNYLHGIISRRTKENWIPWQLSQSQLDDSGWHYPLCSMALYNSEIFQELIKRET